MKAYILSACLAGSFVIAGCDSKGVPVDYANICSPANDQKTIEVTGYFRNTGSAMCSNSKNDSTMRCPINFVDSPTTAVPVRAYIARGKGASEIENVDKQGLKIRDAAGAFIENTQKVKITASVRIFTTAPSDKNSAACYLPNVKKIEKV